LSERPTATASVQSAALASAGQSRLGSITAMTPPPTVIVVHPRERRAKCTVRPLRGLPGFEFRRFPLREAIPDGYVRLGLGGPVLTPDDADRGLLVLDGTWRWAGRMEAHLADVPVRSLPPLKTAYPRTSKVFDDPAGGLATVEAIYSALVILGRPTDGVLDRYYWRDEFLRINAEVWESRAAR
jgi:pre-rRNA-processing protein TSR3